MTYQNRVDPFGNLVATQSRGTLMGNRGCLHDDTGKVRKSWARKAWVTCCLKWKGTQRSVFSDGRYSELFFLDEATAFAAGHRPCNRCQSEAYSVFKTAWQSSQSDGQFVKADVMDNQIHSERLNRSGEKRTFSEVLQQLPDGVMVTTLDAILPPCLLWRGQLWAWSFAGYSAPIRATPSTTVSVLTPRSYCAVLASGYRLNVHPSCLG